MRFPNGTAAALCLFVLCLVVAPKTKANEQPGDAVVTFAVPVEVPGVDAQILPAGTYRFMTLESTSDRDIIQVSSQDGSHVFTTMLGVPNSRLKAPDLVTVVFTNRPAADPIALKAWYCPGRIWGDEIVYEKARATQLAKETNEPVLSTAAVQTIPSVAVLKTALIEAVGPGGETVALVQVVDVPPAFAESPVAVKPSTSAATVGTTDGATAAAASSLAAEPVVATETTVSARPATAVVPIAPAPVVAVAPVEPPVTARPVAATAPAVTAEPASVPASEMATATLPKTASLLPLIGLVGLLMLGAGFLLTSLMKRRA